MKFYKCDICGNIVEMVNDSGMPLTCCGEEMTELIPGTTDGAHEKHVPVYSFEGNEITVKVGAVDHPMLETHYIEWILLETDKGVYRKNLKPGDVPMAKFTLKDNEKFIAAYEYCNIHGLWIA